MQTRDEIISFLKVKRQNLVEEIASLEKNLEHLNATIRMLEKESLSITIDLPVQENEFPIAKLKGLKQIEALMVIAKHFGGTVKAQEVKKIMIEAGVMKATKNSTNITHNLIIRTGKFERIAPGEYRLKAETSEPNTAGLVFHVQ